ncbi:hypothetical protein INR49_023046 [Caranx melampygus]|nr:hypothetical protein INR49_023046 [Caranx melampygus]
MPSTLPPQLSDRRRSLSFTAFRRLFPHHRCSSQKKPSKNHAMKQVERKQRGERKPKELRRKKGWVDCTEEVQLGRCGAVLSSRGVDGSERLSSALCRLMGGPPLAAAREVWGSVTGQQVQPSVQRPTQFAFGSLKTN